MNRYVLVIGLGTTGATICSSLIERLLWDRHDLSEVPNIRFLAIETADATGEAVGRTNNLISIPVQKNAELDDLLTNMDQWKARIDPEAWVDPQIRGILRNLAGPGAGNIRQIGRLGILFPAHYHQITAALQSRLTALTAQAQKETGALTAGVPSHIDVYIVGSLCGGTGSGIFTDMPYIVRNVHGFSPGMSLHGIFTLYPANGMNNEFGANTYQALREYHHWATPGVSFHALYDGHPVNTEEAPYSMLSLVSPHNDTQPEVRRTEAAIADYIHTRVFAPDAQAIVAGKSADYASGFSTQSRNGQQQLHATFGISGIEYPARRYVELCRLTLAQNSLADWVNSKEDDPPVHDNFMANVRTRLTELGLMGSAHGGRAQHRFMKTDAGIDLGQAMRDAVADAAKGGDHDNQSLVLASAQIDSAFGDKKLDGKSLRDLPFDSIRLTINDRCDATYRPAREGLAQALRQTLLDPQWGLHYARVFVEESERLLKEEARVIAQADPGSGVSAFTARASAAKRLKEQTEAELDAARNDLLLKALWGKTWAMPRLLKEWTEATQEYYTNRVSEQEAKAARAGIASILGDLQGFRESLSEGAYLSKYAGAFLKSISDDLRDEYNNSPSTCFHIVDGVSHERIAAEYQETFSRRGDLEGQWRQREIEAKKELLGVFEPLALGLLSSGSASDEPLAGPRRPIPSVWVPDELEPNPTEKAEMLVLARNRFASIENRRVLDVVENQIISKRQDTIRRMVNDSELMLGLKLGDTTRFEQLEIKKFDVLFFNGQPQMRANPVPPQVQSFAKDVTDSGSEILLHNSFDHSDIHRIIVIREQTAFPLSVVEGFESDTARYPTFVKEAVKGHTYPSRSDVADWLPVDHIPEAEEAVRQFLVLVALGEIATNTRQVEFVDGPNRWTLSHNLKDLHVKFGSSREFRDAVSVAMLNRIYSFRTNPQRGIDDFVLKIDEFVRNVAHYPLMDEAARPLTPDRARGWLIPYLRRDGPVWKAWSKIPGNEPPSINLEMLFREDGTELPSGVKAHPEGYYCDCGFRFGSTKGDVERLKSCLACKKVYIYD